MDFIFGLPPTKDNDSIWVIVDRLTKTTHFIRMKMRTRMDVLAQKYIEKVIKLQCTPVSIMLTEMRLFGQILGQFTSSYGHYLEFQHNLSPSDWEPKSFTWWKCSGSTIVNKKLCGSCEIRSRRVPRSFTEIGLGLWRTKCSIRGRECKVLEL